MLPTREKISQFEKVDMQSIEIKNYLNWTQSKNEIVAYNGYGIFELEIPASFDFLIDLNDPNGGIDVESTIQQTIWNGMLPLNIIHLGYKTISIIEFNDGISHVLNELNYYEESDFKLRFALCNKKNKELILNKIKTAASTM